MTGELSDSSVSCSVYKVTGDTERVLTADKTLKYTRLPDGATGTLTHDGGNSAAIAVLANTEAVVFELYDGSVLLDRERVVVLSDASDLEVGGTNLLRRSGATIERTYDAYGDHYFALADRTIHMEQGKTYTISAQSNATFIDASLHGSTSKDQWVSLWIVSPSDVTENRVNELVTGTDMTSDGSKGHTFKWTKPTGDYVLRVNFYAPGTWWVRKIMIERGNVATSWSPSPEDTDYLTRALLENTTIDGGLILTTLIQLGYTDINGGRRVMAGVNGFCTSDADITFWSGGPMVDKRPPSQAASAVATDDDTDGATYLMRADGTGYAADGVLQFEKNHIGVGDSVILDSTGLHLMDGNSERLRVANVAIDDSFLAASMPKQDLSKSAVAEVSGMPVNKESYIYGAHSTSIVNLWVLTLPVGATISLDLSYYDTFTQPQLGMVSGISIPSILEVVLNGKVVHSGTSAVRFTTREAGEYTIRHHIRPTVSGAPDTRYAITVSRHLTVSGAVSFPASDKLTLGNNGLAAIFGQIALVAADGKITLRAGDFGFRLSPTLGIQYNKTGLDTGWTSLV